MLVNLHVKNMALIKEMEIDLGRGLNILTGETGAGKSILIGSINVALGMQGFKDYVTENASSALVELIFVSKRESVRAKMEEFEIPMEDGQIILSRRLLNGRSISKINGETVPAGKIRELASLLIDIHGQHEHQSLLYKKNHLQILDEFAKQELGSLKTECAALYEAYQKYRKKREEAILDEAARKKEMDFLKFEIDEIDQAALRIGEDEELETQFRKMQHARKIAEYAGEAYEETSEGQNSAADLISAALQKLLSVSEYDEELSGLTDQLGEIENLMSDFNRELSSYLSNLTFDEYEFTQMQERLDELNRLKVKYGNSISEILHYREEKEKRYQELLDYDAYLLRLEKDYKESERRLTEAAEQLSGIRKKYAVQLSERIRCELVDLNFLDVKFEVAVERSGRVSANGFDDVCLLISMNPGSPLKPLGNVASGGELSRIMLAIKTVLADKDQTETLIFDEIDVGISGRTAQKVSEKMAVIARDRQVISITHLAQIASMADTHFLIEKSVQDQKTVTEIRRLDREESVEELARILGGTKITDTTLQSAKEMKEMAEAAKKY